MLVYTLGLFREFKAYLVCSLHFFFIFVTFCIIFWQMAWDLKSCLDIKIQFGKKFKLFFLQTSEDDSEKEEDEIDVRFTVQFSSGLFRRENFCFGIILLWMNQLNYSIVLLSSHSLAALFRLFDLHVFNVKYQLSRQF